MTVNRSIKICKKLQKVSQNDPMQHMLYISSVLWVKKIGFSEGKKKRNCMYYSTKFLTLAVVLSAQLNTVHFLKILLMLQFTPHSEKNNL